MTQMESPFSTLFYVETIHGIQNHSITILNTLNDLQIMFPHRFSKLIQCLEESSSPLAIINSYCLMDCLSPGMRKENPLLFGSLISHVIRLLNSTGMSGVNHQWFWEESTSLEMVKVPSVNQLMWQLLARLEAHFYLIDEPIS